MPKVERTQNAAIIESLTQVRESFKADPQTSVENWAQNTIQSLRSQGASVAHAMPPSLGGIKVMRSSAKIKLTGHGSNRAVWIPQRRYDEALQLVAEFCAQGTGRKVAWIFHAESLFIPYPPGLESRGIDISSVLFVETATPERALKTICDELYFSSIIFDAGITQVSLQTIRRWLRPAHLPALARADILSDVRHDRLAILID